MDMRIRERAYEIWQETGCEDADMNWHLAQLDILKEDYYRMKYRCPSCGRKRRCLPKNEKI
jgi:hypothetical protein